MTKEAAARMIRFAYSNEEILLAATMVLQEVGTPDVVMEVKQIGDQRMRRFTLEDHMLPPDGADLFMLPLKVAS